MLAGIKFTSGKKSKAKATSAEKPATTSNADSKPSTASAAKSAGGPQRDAWMMSGELDSLANNHASVRKKVEKEKPRAETDSKYFYPTSEAAEEKAAKSVVVGDGGAAWRRKAIQRAKERAAENEDESGLSMEERLRQRHGEVADLDTRTPRGWRGRPPPRRGGNFKNSWRDKARGRDRGRDEGNEKGDGSDSRGRGSGRYSRGSEREPSNRKDAGFAAWATGTSNTSTEDGGPDDRGKGGKANRDKDNHNDSEDHYREMQRPSRPKLGGGNLGWRRSRVKRSADREGEREKDKRPSKKRDRSRSRSRSGSPVRRRRRSRSRSEDRRKRRSRSGSREHRRNRSRSGSTNRRRRSRSKERQRRRSRSRSRERRREEAREQRESEEKEARERDEAKARDKALSAVRKKRKLDADAAEQEARSSFLYGGSSSNTDRATFAKKVIAVETAALAPSSNKRQRTKATSSTRDSAPPGYKGPPLSSKAPPGYKGPPLAADANDSDTAMEDDNSGEPSVFPVSDASSSHAQSGKKKKMKHVGQDEINKMAAQAMKAQIRGDDKKHAKLKKKLERMQEQLKSQKAEARASKSSSKPANARKRADGDDDEAESDDEDVPDNVMLISELDEAGRQRTFAHSRADRRVTGRENDSIHDMKQRELMSSARDFHEDLAGSLARNKKFAEMNSDEQFDVADIRMFHNDAKNERRKNKKKSDAEREAEDRRRQIQAHNRVESMLDKCWFCYKSARFSKDLLVSMGLNAYLSLAARPPLTDFQCQIVPLEHIASTRQCEGPVFEEIQYFKKCLTKMFQRQKRGVIFLETVLQVRQKFHTFIDCISVSENEFADAPIYFQKALMEAGEHGSAHKVRIVDTRKRSLQESIPANFPYFHVEFGTGGGFAHVIDDDSQFSKDFGLEVMCGLLELDTQIVLRQRKEKKHERAKRVDAFRPKWKPFDWTRKLTEGKRPSKGAAQK